MKILIPTLTPALDSKIDPQLGRSAYFIIVQTDTMEYEVIKNQWRTLECGAGLQAARLALENDVEVVISKDCGPKAFSGLKTASIAVYDSGESRTGSEALQSFFAGKLQEIHAPTLGGHTSSQKQEINATPTVIAHTEHS